LDITIRDLQIGYKYTNVENNLNTKYQILPGNRITQSFSAFAVGASIVGGGESAGIAFFFAGAIAEVGRVVINCAWSELLGGLLLLG
jgi:hypothetical protein